MTNWEDWVYQHETLTSGLLALIAAFFTVRFLCLQIKQSDRHNKDRRSRKFESARAVLPLALSRLVDYANHALDFSLIGKGRFDKPEGYEKAFPQLPDDVVPVFREVIEYADDEKVGHTLRELISEIQVHHARMTSLPRKQVTIEAGGRERINLTISYEKAIFDAAHLFLHASTLFDYARFETDKLPEKPTDEDVERMLSIRGIPIPESQMTTARP